MLNKSKLAAYFMLLLFCGLASACSTGNQNAELKSVANQNIELKSEKRECGIKGGAWQKVCLRGYKFCVMPYSDAGKPCRGSSDCQGRCVENVKPQTESLAGQCQANNNPCGCFANIENNKLAGILCVD